MAYLTMKQLLEAGVHFGHQTKRWDPKMKSYIFGARNGIYIIDLQQTVKLFKTSYDFIKNITAKNKKVIFVGTKKQAQTAIADEATRGGMPYVNQRWLGGMLTNFSTIKKSVKKLHDLEAMKIDGKMEAVTKKEGLLLEKERIKLDKYLKGIKDMNELPGAIFVIDVKKEVIAIQEAKRLGIPVVAVVDTNCSPDNVDYVIPGNDDAIRAIQLFVTAIADACLEGSKFCEEGLQALTNKEQTDNAIETSTEINEEAIPILKELFDESQDLV